MCTYQHLFEYDNFEYKRIESVERDEEGQFMKFYTIKLPKFIGSIVRVMIGTFKKDG